MTTNYLYFGHSFLVNLCTRCCSLCGNCHVPVSVSRINDSCMASPFIQHTFIWLSVITMQLLGIYHARVRKNGILEKWRFLGQILVENVGVRKGKEDYSIYVNASASAEAVATRLFRYLLGGPLILRPVRCGRSMPLNGT